MIRRRLLSRLPALTRFYGLEPEAWERMTFAEVDEFVGYYRAWTDAERKHQRELEQEVG